MIKRISKYLILFLLGIFSLNASAFYADSIGRRIEKGKIIVLHKVESKQTIYAISKIYDVPAETIYHDNPTSKVSLKVGQILKIRTGRYLNQPQTVQNGLEKTHIVGSKQTMYAISKLYNISIDDIKKWNGLSSNELTKGQVLKIKNTNTAISAVKTKTTPSVNSSNKKTHKVESKQTLYAISKLYNLNINDIKSWNNLSSNELSTGQVLIVSGKKTAKPTPISKTVRQPITKTPPTTNNSNFNPNSKFHTVIKGETLFGLSKKYNVEINDIAEWNNLTSNSLTEGQMLIINGESESSGGSAMDALMAVNSEEKAEYKTPTRVHSQQTTPSNTNHVKLQDHYDVDENHSEQNKVEEALALSQQHLNDHSVKKQQYTKSTSNSGSTTKAATGPDKNHWFIPSTISNYEDTIKYGIKSMKTGVGKYGKVVETGVCELIEDNHWDSKYNALHHSAAMGTIIQVRNPKNDISVFVRVVGRLVETAENQGDIIKISHHAVERLAPSRSRFPIQIFYLP